MLIRSSYVDFGERKKKYILFSKAGFESELLGIKDLILLTPEDIVEKIKSNVP
ncbi:hypothetical protein [Thermosipho africanus]|uniref:hypothetical protein n=1 Tax=Thermosipho africanus TaxID=2421 RepID=UPI0020112C96|nr:hypothetical protein [Thermosipho africanus]